MKRDIFQAHPLLCFPSWSHLSDRRSVEVLALIPDTSLSYVWLILRRCDDLLLDLVTPPRAKVISKSEGTSLRVRNITYFPPPFFSLSKFKFIHRQDKLSSSSFYNEETRYRNWIIISNKQVYNDNKIYKRKEEKMYHLVSLISRPWTWRWKLSAREKD